MKLDHNLLAWVFPLLIAVLLAVFVFFVPAIGLAPEETTLKVLLRVAIFFGAWALALRFLGGWRYSVTEEAKQRSITGMDLIASAIIIGCALVIAK